MKFKLKRKKKEIISFKFKQLIQKFPKHKDYIQKRENEYKTTKDPRIYLDTIRTLMIWTI